MRRIDIELMQQRSFVRVLEKRKTLNRISAQGFLF